MSTGIARSDYVRMLSAVYASMFLIRLAFGVVIVTFAEYVDANDFAYSLVVTASPLAELITVVFAGVLIDKYGRKGVLLTGLGLGAFSLYGLALTQNLAVLTLLQGIHGIAAALILVTTLAVIATYAPHDQRGRAMGIFNLVNIVGWIGGFVLGSLLTDAFEGQLEYTFVIAGALATVGLLYANRAISLPSEERRADAGGGASIGQLARAVVNPRVLVLTAPWLIVFILVGSFITFFPRVADRLDITGGRVALATLLVGALMLASQYFWGRLADRHGRESIMLVGAVGFAALMALIAFAYFAAPDHVDTVALERFVVDNDAITTAAAAPRGAEGGDDAPIIESVSPTGASAGASVVIVGRGLDNVTAARFNGARSPVLEANEDGTRLVVQVPEGASDGPLVLESPTPPQVVFDNVVSHGILLSIFLFVALAFAPAGLAALADEAQEGAQGTTMSAYSLTLSLGFIVGPPVLGAVSASFGGNGMIVFFVILAAGLLALVGARFLQRRRAA